ncbi:transferrin-binding protein-like solute binding protein [Caulobacter hibisci]|uniref:Transferrin-binding protein B C-lobe/N-lobe beta-barrel domain-containing protein n=1 Tax=Caulobacter hibisci TaxID=2035993 RepID=A0ABS0T4L1_9CAUL|nr:transferrin-binding protein-like solute binding protein [Caulobacter hibisci]MBI1686822.1 hypothetical protein [Caulobacter hibisci]
MVSLAVLGMASLVAACGGGGGGGGPSTGVTTPTPPPPTVTPTPPAPVPVNGMPVSDCAARPTALSCGARTAVALLGGFVRRDTSPVAGAAPTYQLSATAVSGNGASFSSGDPTVGGDETITLNAATSSATLKSFGPTFVGGSDALGGYTQRDLGNGQRLRIYNLNQGSTPSLDYVLLTRFDGLWEGTDGVGGAKISAPIVLYGAFGQTASLSRGTYRGTASYAGQTRGLVISGGTDLDTRSDLAVNLNLETGYLSGRTSNFQVLGSNGVVAAPAQPLDFVFTATLAGWSGGTAASTFSGVARGAPGTDSTLRGMVEGAFYGAAGGQAEEIAFAYNLGSNLDSSSATTRIIGVGGAGLTAAMATSLPAEASCATAPGQIACATSALTLSGASTSTTASSSTATDRRIDAAGSAISVTFTPGDPTTTTDDRYTVRYGPSGYESTYQGLSTVNDGLSSYRRAVQTVGGRGEALYLMDINNVFASSLDYVQLVSFERDLGTSAQLAFLNVGAQTAASSMPTTGTGKFEGETRGTLFLGQGSGLYTTASDIEMTANFATGAVSGSTFNFRTRDQSGNLNTLANNPDFTFSASIASGTSTFSGSATQSGFGGGAQPMTGTVQGGFYGPGAAEAGLAYSLQSSSGNAWMQGAAVLGRKP